MCLLSRTYSLSTSHSCCSSECWISAKSSKPLNKNHIIFIYVTLRTLGRCKNDGKESLSHTKYLTATSEGGLNGWDSSQHGIVGLMKVCISQGVERYPFQRLPKKKQLSIIILQCQIWRFFLCPACIGVLATSQTHKSQIQKAEYFYRLLRHI